MILKRLRRVLSFVLAIALTLVFQVAASPQDSSTEWERVLTDSEFYIDSDQTSLRLESGQRLIARFRTVLSKPESLDNKSRLKYKTRIDTYEFNGGESYRIVKTELLDASEKVLVSTDIEQPVWKPTRGRTVAALYNAAVRLPPFGAWKVTGGRFSNGSPIEPSDISVQKLTIPTFVNIHIDGVQAGNSKCWKPEFETRVITDKEFGKSIGGHLKDLGIGTDVVNALIIKCDGDGKAMPQSILLQLPERRGLLLYDGVFFDMIRDKK